MNHAETIINLTAKYFEIPVELLAAKTRKREVVMCRMSAMAMMKKFTEMSLKSIGRNFGGRDHATVIHAIQTIEDLEDCDPSFSNKLEILKELLLREIYPTNFVEKVDNIDREFEHLI